MNWAAWVLVGWFVFGACAETWFAASGKTPEPSTPRGAVVGILLKVGLILLVLVAVGVL